MNRNLILSILIHAASIIIILKGESKKKTTESMEPQNYVGSLFKMWFPGLSPRDPESEGLGGTRDASFLTSAAGVVLLQAACE